MNEMMEHLQQKEEQVVNLEVKEENNEKNLK